MIKAPSSQNRPSSDELLDIGERLAQELQDFVDEASEAGSPLKSGEELLNDWNDVWRRSDRYWNARHSNCDDDQSSGLTAL